MWWNHPESTFRLGLKHKQCYTLPGSWNYPYLLWNYERTKLSLLQYILLEDKTLWSAKFSNLQKKKKFNSWHVKSIWKAWLDKISPCSSPVKVWLALLLMMSSAPRCWCLSLIYIDLLYSYICHSFVGDKLHFVLITPLTRKWLLSD